MVSESLLEMALRLAWQSGTSSDTMNWSFENPAWGQCAVTSLVVNDYLGGEIIWAMAKLSDGREISHYFNKINGIERDFTRCQFPEETIIPMGVPKPKEYRTTRDYLLSSPNTRTRYELLRETVKKQLSCD